MADQGYLSDATAEELLAMSEGELNTLLESRVAALSANPSLSLEASVAPPGALEAFEIPPWVEKTAKQMLNTAIRQLYNVVCSADADYAGLRAQLISALGVGGTAAVVALAGFLTSGVGLAAALASVIATILIKKIVQPALAAGLKTLCQELAAYLPPAG